LTDPIKHINHGILTYQEIVDEINNGRLIRYGDNNKVQACSYDMRVGTIFRDGQIINNEHPNRNRQVIIEPGEIVCMLTKEELILPEDIAATAFPINEQSSKGFLVLNPGHVDPGYDGPLTIKAINVSKAGRPIAINTDIFTVIFERLSINTQKMYSNNINRNEREHKYNERDVEYSPKSLSQLVVFGKDAPFPTREEVEKAIRRHWLSWLTLGLTAVAAIAALATFVHQIYFSAPKSSAYVPSVVNITTSPGQPSIQTSVPKTPDHDILEGNKSQKNKISSP
jgi:deoxycytidine triphosphate deaminase